MSKKLKITTGAFKIQSSWTCKKMQFFRTDHVEDEWVFDKAPSTGQKKVSFKYSLKSGSKIKSAYIWANVTSGSGISKATVNGTALKWKSGKTRTAKISLKSTSGTLSAVFTFKPTGTIYKDTNRHYAYGSFTNVYLQIEYEEPKGKQPAKKPAKSTGFSIPPQSVCIYDKEGKSIYTFDGVTKINHVLSMDIQEEPEKNKKDYVNNAKNQPDKVTLDVVMSDVYTGGGALVKQAKDLSTSQKSAFKSVKGKITESAVGDSRSERAFYTLHWLKESRKKLIVITPQYVHVDMILESVTVNQDSNCPFGWEGQLVFQHAYKKKATTKKANKKNNGKERLDPSLMAQGKIRI